MSLTLYDDALLEKIHRWTAGTEVRLTGVNEYQRLFETVIDTGNDKQIQLPLIAISRPGGFTILNKNKRQMSFAAPTFIVNSQRHATLNAIPIGIAYQIDIYTKYMQEADEYARNFIFNIINYPKLTIEIPYENLGLKHDANIRITSEVDDNSDIPERLIPGQFTRLSIGLNIDDAYLFDVRIKDNISIKEISVIPDEDPRELITLIN